MSEFVASNGIRINEYGALIQTASANLVTAAHVHLARIEFYQRLRDEELGRWRWPSNPDLVVYADNDGDVTVLDERKGRSSSLIIRADVAMRNPTHPHTEAARAYFEAHPEGKPWDDADKGDIWALTFETGGTSAWVRGERCWHLPDSPEAKLSIPAFPITAGRRIWPEDAS